MSEEVHLGTFAMLDGGLKARICHQFVPCHAFSDFARRFSEHTQAWLGREGFHFAFGPLLLGQQSTLCNWKGIEGFVQRSFQHLHQWELLNYAVIQCFEVRVTTWG